uniref:TPM domain-containing protein n=1 Tax=Eucampia antarctica TaxID=49252 RepID=A0A7S2W1Y3_9STRA|mmetsp:Transcript_18079/g.17440  ORF Transcript_18079/g.17440 Transcript_18079/m.17440 type:complete len:246 (+) Transcript_18079:88-825(+)|eukprot:CAMPEP_0197832284 /NCGR_PEP_ID=MMETSP1437-20131217/14078_1 /TAXON_ID=49252 ORGANISM="Eucampia antarctica, Strain CCMP1452" /NCGR_SAMPLE_ID=MMETSP1437 /ASSEMBLY_ACC=CAM_ASM_001096 /LENGTH=245 /DNA_ID=CAMNT_0043435579 /DNA_START=86 /DNA_END=823 /DNA_ORIENTATION=+
MRICNLLLVLSAAVSTSAFTLTSSKDVSHKFYSALASSMDNNDGEMDRRSVFSSAVKTAITTASIFAASDALHPEPASARLEPVNRPDLLPTAKGLNVIQTEKFLTAGQEKRLNSQLAKLEQDTGFRVRVLCQAYPNTPGLAIRDYWDLGKEDQKDDKYIVLIVDQFGGKGNSLNFNVGEGIKFALPNVFWTRLQAKYGTTFFVRDNGIDIAVTNAIDAVVQCLRSEDQFCVNVPEQVSMKSLGF